MDEPVTPSASSAPQSPVVPSSSSGARSAEKPLKGIVKKVKRAFSMKKKDKEKAKAVDVTKPDTIPEAEPDTKETEAVKTEPTVPKSAAPKPATPKPAVPKLAAPPKAAKRPPGPPPPVLSPAQRAQALFKKHGLDFTPSHLEFSTAVPHTERVHKEIRMRVHRTCHKCDVPFGADKICINCGHRRCKRCPRFPNHVKKDHKDKGGEKREVKPIRRRKGELGAGLTIPNRCGGPDLERHPIRQRVHRTCHRCKTDFGREKICIKCQHKRCKKCPREPHKKHKPPGHYDDRDSSDSEAHHFRPKRTYKKPRQRVHWICTKCETTFTVHSKVCSGCGSQRDKTGRREPPAKKGKNPNTTLPEASYMEQLQERMKSTSIA